MIYNYTNFLIIKEGSQSNPDTIYWFNSLNEALNKTWSDIKIQKYRKVNYSDTIYGILFKIGDDKYDYYQVLIEKKNNDEEYLMEDSDKNVIKLFIEKFKKEFWNNAGEYIQNFEYVPKCLGDVSGVKRSVTTGLWDLNKK
jgi:hypothetical protein